MESKDGGLQELLNGCKRKSEPFKEKRDKSTSVLFGQLSMMSKNMEKPQEDRLKREQRGHVHMTSF